MYCLLQIYDFFREHENMQQVHREFGSVCESQGAETTAPDDGRPGFPVGQERIYVYCF